MQAPRGLGHILLSAGIAASLLCGTVAQTAVTNGGFEEPPGVYPYMVFGAGLNLPGWTIESGTVEIVGKYWQAAEGSQSLDLNGIFEEIGTIYQDVPTVAGKEYRIRFAMAGNPEGGPAVKSLKVSWDSNLLAHLEFDTTGHSATNMGWRYHEFVVTARGAQGRLRFQSTCSSFLGPTLDDISVTPADEPLPPPPPPPATTNLLAFSNPGFEQPPGIGTYRVFTTWSPPPGWVVENGTVEIVGPYWQAAEGSQSLDLNGIYDYTGAIYQEAGTVPGHRYRIRFALAGNPEGGPVVKTVKVFWNNDLLGHLEFDTTGRSFTDMGWRYHEYMVTASTSVGRLKFQSTTPSFCGPALDDISVVSLDDTNPPPPPPSTNTVALGNGGFEQPPGIDTYRVFYPWSPPPGWVIESGTVEIVGPYWQAAEGCQSLDLNGIFEDIGTIYQDVTTQPGQRYRIRFAMAGNPEGGPVVKTMKVFWNDNLLGHLEFDTTGRTLANMGWRYHEYVVAASGRNGRLRFQSTCSSFLGPTLDDVSITPVADSTVQVTHPPPLVTMQASRQPGLVIHGQAGRVYRVEYSTNLLGGAWQAITNLVLPDSRYEWKDPNASPSAQAFYRAVLIH